MLSVRRVSRVVVLDASGAVLLCRYSEAGHPYWVPPGGALEPGESHRDAAVRELREETGLVVQLESRLWERRFTLHQKTGPIEQHEQYYLARVPTERPEVHNVSAEDIEELRWWTLSELAATAYRVYPDGLTELLPALIAGQVPGA